MYRYVQNAEYVQNAGILTRQTTGRKLHKMFKLFGISEFNEFSWIHNEKYIQISTKIATLIICEIDVNISQIWESK